MDPKTLVIQYLDEAHATETALVTNLGAHMAMTSDPEYRELLRQHQQATAKHAEAIERRRQALGRSGGRSLLTVTAGLARDAVGQVLVLSKGPLDLIRTSDQNERMLKNAKDECATEALEIATYDAIESAAKAAGDTVTASLAADHRRDEEQMLADLRSTIKRLAVATVETKTTKKVKPQVKAAANRNRKRTTAGSRS